MAFNVGASSGNLVLLDNQIVSGASSVDWTSLIDSTYDVFYLAYDSVTMSTTGQINFRASTNNGSSYLSTAIYSEGGSVANSDGSGGYALGGQTQIRWIDRGTNASTSGISGNMYLYQFNSTSLWKSILWNLVSTGNIYADGKIAWISAAGSIQTTSACNALQIYPASGTISGNFKFYGVQN